jgi:quinol monooxygenase YgiN
VKAAPLPAECGVVELRRYTLHPGRRDELIDLFEREFVHSQERAGICLLGLFRDDAADDQFVWFRGFRSMRQRLGALTEFYGGATWAAQRDAANATMVDSDDVLLLRPTHLASVAWRAASPGRIHLAVADVAGLDGARRPEVLPVDDRTLARFETLHAENDFPRLPVRSADVVVSLSTAATAADGRATIARTTLAPTARSR